jgi:hypothetical protein
MIIHIFRSRDKSVFTRPCETRPPRRERRARVFAHSQQGKQVMAYDSNAATNAGSIGMQIEHRAPVLKTSTGKRGRPRGSAKHPDFYSEVWITVRLYQIRSRISTGKTPSIKEVCDELAARGGVISAVGGDVAKLAEENSKRGKQWPRCEVDSTGRALTPSSAGPIFSDHSITHPSTLRGRYNEANRITKSDRLAWLFWRDLCRQRLGFPAKRPRPRRMAQSNG